MEKINEWVSAKESKNKIALNFDSQKIRAVEKIEKDLVQSFYEKSATGSNKDHVLLIQFLEKEGFAKYYKLDESVQMVHLKDNILKEVSIYNVVDFLIKKTKNEHDENGYRLIVENSGLFKSDLVKCLSTISVNRLRDTKEVAYLYFKNGILAITANELKMISYQDAIGMVEQSKIKDFELRLWDKPKGVMKKFVECIAGSSNSKRCDGDNKLDTDRIKSLESIIGYCCTNYKDKKHAKAIVLLDSKINYDDQANGGVGKSLLIKLLGKVKDICNEDGKTFAVRGNKFAFQNITHSTDLLVIDDVMKRTSLDPYFAQITGETIVEGKGVRPYKISFEEAPKLIITSNYPIEGSGNSFERRLHEFELSDYFVPDHSPFDEFGQTLMDDWVVEDYNDFYNYIIHCIQVYQKNGIVKSNSINLEQNRLIASLGEPFVDFAKELTVNINYKKSLALLEFDPDSRMSSHQFTKNLKRYAFLSKYKYDERKSNGEYIFQFVSNLQK